MITTLTIDQNNKVGDSDLLAVHSPVVFLVSADYTGDTPEFIYCDVKDADGLLLGTFKLIPYQDLSVSSRQFMFLADSILRGYMEDFEDFNQSENSLVYVEGLTKQFTLLFRDPDAVAGDKSLNIVASHAKRQYGENPNMTNQYNNENEVIYAETGQSCYVYFYNNDEANVLTIGQQYEVKFIVSDLGGFVENASITIGTETKLTDINGEATFSRANGNYNYLITKSGYVNKSGSFGVSNANLVLNVTIVAQVLEPVLFQIDKKGVSEIFTLNAYSSDGLTLIATGNTTAPGNEVTLNLSLPDSYLIEVVYNCWDWEYSEVLALTNTSSPVSIVPTVQLPQIEITFSVTDFDTGLPLSGVAITKDGVDDFGAPCYSGALTTNGSGEAVKTVRGAISPDFKDYLYNCALTNYSTVNGTASVNGDDLAIQIDIQLVNQVVATPPIVTSDSIDQIEKDNFRASGEVVSDGGSALLTQGVCYALYPTIPTISGDKVTVTPAVGAFNVNIPGLTGLNTYSIRAYASNAEGLTYGAVVTETIPFVAGGINAYYLINDAICNLNLENSDTITLRFGVDKTGGGYVNTDQVEAAGPLRSVNITYNSGGPFVGGELWRLQVIVNGHVSLLASGTL